jgi:hypothetical protein
VCGAKNAVPMFDVGLACGGATGHRGVQGSTPAHVEEEVVRGSQAGEGVKVGRVKCVVYDERAW